MTRIRWSLVLLALGLAPAGARAQFAPFYNPYFAYGGYGYGGFGAGGLFNYARFGRHGGLALSLGGFGGRGYFYGPGFYPYGPGFYPGFYPTFNRITVMYYSPPPVVVLPPSMLMPGIPLDILPRNRLDLEPEMPGDMPPPGNRGQPPPVPPPERPKPPPKKEEPPAKKKEPPRKEAPKPPPQPPLPPPQPPPPDEEGPEDARLTARGQRAFANQEYGRAAHLFRRAADAAPRKALPHFLLAQALFALGKYPDAVRAIHAGLALDPGWPAAGFRPLNLYGPHVTDYADHLHRLEDTLARHPDDPVLLFLYAYQLWFDGRKEEARSLFERALPGAADPAAIDRFLRALPPAPVL